MTASARTTDLQELARLSIAAKCQLSKPAGTSLLDAASSGQSLTCQHLCNCQSRMHAQSLGLEDSEGSTADMSELHTLQKMPDCFVSFRMLRSAKYAVADSEFDIKMLICPR